MRSGCGDSQVVLHADGGLVVSQNNVSRNVWIMPALAACAVGTPCRTVSTLGIRQPGPGGKYIFSIITLVCSVFITCLLFAARYCRTWLLHQECVCLPSAALPLAARLTLCTRLCHCPFYLFKSFFFKKKCRFPQRTRRQQTGEVVDRIERIFWQGTALVHALTLLNDGNLALTDAHNVVLWSTNTRRSPHPVLACQQAAPVYATRTCQRGLGTLNRRMFSAYIQSGTWGMGSTADPKMPLVC